MMSTASSILAAKNRSRQILGSQEMTLHCSSFSKCLVPGFRIGWVAAGKHARRIQQLQLMSTLSTSSPMQMALVDYLSTKRYDAHLPASPACRA
jgi:DNA-binding transcriptional MocR family regulator